jgi:tetratricopeptide (TPR) repeat protein
VPVLKRTEQLICNNSPIDGGEMGIPNLSNVKMRALAIFGGILSGTAIGCHMEGISAAAAAVMTDILMNVAAQDAGVMWEKARRGPRHAGATLDLTKLIGSAIARTLFSCAESHREEGAKAWFSAIATVATEKYLDVCEQQSLEVIRGERIPELFAKAAKTEKRVTMRILDEFTEIKGKKCTVAYALLDFLREKANQSLNDEFMEAGEDALINELFSNVREMFTRSFEGNDRAFGALALDVWAECVGKLYEVLSEQSQLKDALKSHASEWAVLSERLVGQVDLLRGETKDIKKQLDEVIDRVRNQSGDMLYLEKSDLFATVESEVQRRLAEHNSQCLEDPSILAKTLASAALEAIRSDDFHKTESQVGGSDAVSKFFLRKRDLYANAAEEFKQVSLESGLKAVEWAFAIGDYDVAFAGLQWILRRHPSEHRALAANARLFMIKRDYGNALKGFRRAIATAETVRELAVSHYGAGLANLYKRQWKRSVDYLREARELVIGREEAWISLQATAYLAEAYDSWKKPAKAIEMLESAIKIGESLASIEDTAECYCHLGMVHSKLGNFSTAEQMHRNSFNWWMQKGEVLHIGQELINVGEACFRQEKWDEAVAEFGKALPYIEKIKDSLRICWVRKRLAGCAAKKREFNLALIHARVAVDHAKKLEDSRWLESSTKLCDEIEKCLSLQQEPT